MMQQFMNSISAANNRPQQQSSPSDSQNSNSMSTATPPHQVSRASPASTALVMSSNNLAAGSQQSNSRQLTPNTSSSNNGTGSSSSSAAGAAAAAAVAAQQHHQQQQQQHVAGNPPNPMVRTQFACHTKSMSAGVVVSVPGISNNLATGAVNNNHHNNNMVNNHHMTHSGGHHQQQHHRALPLDPSDHHQNNTNNHHQRSHHVRSHHGQQHQQVIREHRNPPPPSHHHQVAQHHNSQQQQQHPYNPSESSQNFINARQAAGSSIILSNGNINNIHNRSASTHLSSVLLEPAGNHHQANNQHSQSSYHMNSNSTCNHNHLNSANGNYPSHVTNSIWSIDENISKSHGKLNGSSYIPHPYLFNPSITDMSCDNVSNVSRLIDGPPPAPGYYLHAPSQPQATNTATNLPNSNAFSISGTSIKTPEFLPICDLMFNLISMIIYFCENTFAIIALIALYYHTSFKYWALTGASFVLVSNIINQYLSFKWLYKSKLDDCRRKREAQEELEDEENCERRYYNRMAANMRNYQCGSCAWLPDSATEVQLKFLLSIVLDAITHLLCLGFLVRYIKLVIPVTDTARVKKEARDLCMLRMIHGFVQSAPLLLLQAYMICSQLCTTSITNLSITSVILSLVNVCWALASFTKYARKKYMHKFVLTWLGIVSQLLWRLGTVSSRVAALTIYAVYYSYWMLVILALHWITMFFWLIKPGNLLRDEMNLTRAKKITFAMAAAWIYCFCYVNFEEHNSKLKMTSYYVIMFLENNLLLTVCLVFSSQVTWIKHVSMIVVYLGFVVGMLFMFLYYKYFHVNVLNNGLSCSQESIDSIADQLSSGAKKITGFKPGTLRLKSEDSLTSAHKYNSNISATLRSGSQPEIARNIKPPYLTSSQVPLPQSGVFNCKLNTGFKKQTTQSSHVRRHN